ncbi:hypothetical protein GCM10010844_44090 [Deinococcus radiotolerans]|uniref:Uncharacterized protein n=1 Tax=Deinococcus radiotolerans TaxID=1309407 RepID=A0ABQ2FRR8_9DEIO|nr:hypothetical protein GCM10010844_44090 [Deinococcus radiotolerans]
MIHLILLTALKAAQEAGWTHASVAADRAVPLADLVGQPDSWAAAGPYLLSDAHILDGRGRQCVQLSRPQATSH